jgi:hypothetical protein
MLQTRRLGGSAPLARLYVDGLPMSRKLNLSVVQENRK